MNNSVAEYDMAWLVADTSLQGAAVPHQAASELCSLRTNIDNTLVHSVAVGSNARHVSHFVTETVNSFIDG